MTKRITFIGIVAFWVVMNTMLWRAEIAGNGDDLPVPADLVWRKILTAPDSSSMTVYQDSRRMGYCELTTSVEQQMAVLEEDKLPPEGLARHPGYQIHLAGNIALDDFTNRIKFEGRASFNSARKWSEVALKISSRTTTIEIHAFATNETVNLRVFGEATTFERDFSFTELQDPATLIRAFSGNFAEPLLGAMELPDLNFTGPGESQKISWDARRTRVKFGSELVPIYRLETSILGRSCIMDVSTLGEVLRVQLPGGFTAAIDEWSRP
jgi:hypothetical protein